MPFQPTDMLTRYDFEWEWSLCDFPPSGMILRGMRELLVVYCWFPWLLSQWRAFNFGPKFMLVYTAGSYVVLPAECCIQLENTDINLEVSNMVFF